MSNAAQEKGIAMKDKSALIYSVAAVVIVVIFLWLKGSPQYFSTIYLKEGKSQTPLLVNGRNGDVWMLTHGGRYLLTVIDGPIEGQDPPSGDSLAQATPKE